MKKFVFVVFTCMTFILSFTFGVKLSAKSVDNGAYTNVEALVGYSRNEIEEGGFIERIKELENKKYFKNGYLVYNREFRCYSTGYEFNAYLYFENSVVTKYEIKLGDNVLYKLDINGDEYTLLNKFRFNFTKKDDDGFSSRDMIYSYEGDYNSFYDNYKDIKKEIEAIGFNAVGIYEVDEQNDIYLSTTTNNPKNYLNEYLFKISDVKNINVDETDYYILDNHIDKGRYEIIVSGTKGDKLIIQKVVVNVSEGGSVVPTTTTTLPTTTVEPTTTETTTDVTTSTPTTVDDYNISYKSFINKEAYKNFLKLKYKLSVYELESDYFDNYDKVGKYTCNIIMENNNVTSYINVIDDVKPIIIGNNISVGSNMKYSLAEFKNRLVVYDEIDGDISCKNIVINDLDKYEDNYNKSGVYRIEAKISDLSGNEASSIYNIYVSDNITSGIYIENATIIITDTGKANIDNLITFLKKNGLISSNNVSLDSTYFNTDNPKGDYNLLVDENNNKENYIIQIQNYDDAKKEVKNVVKEEEKKTNYIHIIVISSLALVALVLLGVIIHKKTH